MFNGSVSLRDIANWMAAAEFQFINPNTENSAKYAAFTKLILAWNPQFDGTESTTSRISVPA